MKHITKLCADSLRSFSNKEFGIDLKSSHAHELVAAYFGYSSRAALLADTKCPISNLRQAEFIVLTPTAEIKERRNKLNGLPQNLPDNIAEGVYLPLHDEKLILHKIWPTLEELGKGLADQYLKSKPAYFRDMKVQRQDVKVERDNNEIAIVVFREYVSPRPLLSFQKGRKGIVHVFNLNRVAGHIGYVLKNHHYTEANTWNAAIKKMRDAYYKIISTPQLLNDIRPIPEPEPTFKDWLTKHTNRNSPLGDLANKRGFSDRHEQWPLYDTFEKYLEYLRSKNPPIGATSALERAWKSYQNYLKRKKSPTSVKKAKGEAQSSHDPRKIMFFKNVIPLHYSKRTIENFVPGDQAWISWEGKKSIPVTVVEVDERHYTIRTERPLNKAGEKYDLLLDEVRSTPKLACMNHVTY